VVPENPIVVEIIAVIEAQASGDVLDIAVISGHG
jgi:hypothetical protein